MNETLLKNIRAWVESQRDNIVADLTTVGKVPSISNAQSDVKPFGPGCRQILETMTALGEREGYGVTNYDNYFVKLTANAGDAQSVGFWCHMDVVPVGEGWTYPPFAVTKVDDFLVARGIQDNKYTGIAALYAFKCLQALGVKLRHTYELYYGTSEETGMQDAEYYVANYPCPTVSLVTDAAFPGLLYATGGAKVSLHLEAELPGVEQITCDLVRGRIASAVRIHTGTSVEEFTGKDCAKQAFARIEEKLPEDIRALLTDTTGKLLNADTSDEYSGALTSRLAYFTYQNGVLEASLLLDLPCTCDTEALFARIKEKHDADCVVLHVPSYFPADNPVAKAALEGYQLAHGRKDEYFVASANTYAKKLPRAFCFGMTLPDEPKLPDVFLPGHGNWHGPDEAVCITSVLEGAIITACAVCLMDEAEDISLGLDIE